MLPVEKNCGPNQDQNLVLRKDIFFLIVRAIYGLNSSGVDWISNISETFNSMGYRST